MTVGRLRRRRCQIGLAVRGARDSRRWCMQPLRGERPCQNSSHRKCKSHLSKFTGLRASIPYPYLLPRAEPILYSFLWLRGYLNSPALIVQEGPESPLGLVAMALRPTDAVDGILTGKRYLIHDRDPLFTADFLNVLADAGVQSVKLPARSPNLNAYAERFVRSIKESCLDQMIFFGGSSLRKAVQEFVVHYHLERNHQGLGNRLIMPEKLIPSLS
jgi:hypothetical protein